MSHTLVPWIAAAAAGLLTACCQGLLLTSVVALGLRLLPGLAAGRRSLLWMAVFLLVVLLHFSPPARQAAPSQAGLLRLDPLWCQAIAALWALLSLSRAAQLAWAAIALRRLSRQAAPAACPPACAALLQAARRPASLHTSLALDRPSVIGFRSPRILLPPALLAELSPAELSQVLLHELEHLRRYDDWTNLLQKLVLVLFPLDPVLLWLEHRLCAERELACDDGVLQATRARKAYAACLARLAEHSMHSAVRRGASLALGAWQRQTELARRVHRLLRQPDKALPPRQTALATSLLAFAMLVAAAGLARTPQLVRFASDSPGIAQASMPTHRMTTLARQAPPAHLERVNAIMPAPPTSVLRLTRPLAHHAHASSSLAKRSARLRTIPPPFAADYRVLPAAPPSRWLLLTGWQPPSAPALALPRGIVVPDATWPTYAAVPVPNGWLILQL